MAGIRMAKINASAISLNCGAFGEGAAKLESVAKSVNRLGDGYHDPATEET